MHKKCIREKKRMKRQQDIQIILEDFKGVRNIPGIKSAKEKASHVFGEFYKRLYEDKEKDDSEHEVTDVHNNDTEETAGIPEITTEELQNAINKLKKKANSRTAKEFEPKTSKLATTRREK